MLTDAIHILQRAIISGVLLALALNNALAAGKDGPSIYQVEILLFAINDPAAAGPESWPEMYETDSATQFLYVTHPDTAETSSAQSKDPAKKKATGLPYQLLTPDQFKLAASAAKLKKNPRYEVLLHTAWRQPAIDLKEEKAVYVFDGMTEPEHPVEALPGASAETPARAPAQISETGNPDPRAPRFSGAVKLALGQYLHVALDLLYRKEMRRAGSVDASGNEIATPHNALQSFRLNEIRRIKIGEVHYFDQPVFGALVLIASTEKKAVDVEKETVGADSPVPKVPTDD